MPRLREAHAQLTSMTIATDEIETGPLLFLRLYRSGGRPISLQADRGPFAGVIFVHRRSIAAHAQRTANPTSFQESP